MTVSAADAAGPALPIVGSGAKRAGDEAAEGADVFAALVAGLLGSLATPGDVAGQQDPAGQGQGQPSPGDLDLTAGAMAAGTVAASAGLVPAGAAAPTVPTVPGVPTVPPPAGTPEVGAAETAVPVAPPVTGQSAQQGDVGDRPETAGSDVAPQPGDAAAAEASATAAETAPRPTTAERPDVPVATTLPVAAPVGSAPSHVVQDVAPVAAAAPVAPATPPAPAAQVAAAVGPVLHGPDGSYRVTMHLNPEELGRVAVTVDLQGGSVSLYLHAVETGTGDLLRDSLDALRAELDREGLSAGTLDVSAGDGGSGGRTAQELLREAARRSARESAANAATATATATPAVNPTTGRPSALDVQL